jgi:zinc transporter ZupT
MEDIEQGAWSHTAALAIAYAFFFIGVLLCKGLDLLAASTMHWVARFNSRRKLHSASGSGSGATIAHSAASSSGDLRQCDDAAAADAAPPGGRSAYNLMHSSEADGSSVHVGAGKAAGPARPSTVQALDIETGASGTAKALAVAVPSAHKAGAAAGERKAGQSHHDLVAAGVPVEAVDRAVMDAAAGLADADMCALGRTCVLVWLALTLHNLPEGLATFVG